MSGFIGGGRFGSGSLAGAGGAASGGVLFSNVVLLLHMNGANNGTTFTDSSSSAHTMTRHTSGGKPLTDTGTKEFGTASYYGDFASFLDANYTSDFAFGSGDFTVEGWFNIDSGQGSQLNPVFFLKGNSGYNLRLEVTSSNKLKVTWVDAGDASHIITGTTTVTLPGWHHCAVTRDGVNLNLYLDGVREGTLADLSTNSQRTTNAVYVGGDDTLGAFNGHLDDIRVVKGQAVYTGSTYTVPQQAFPDS